MERPTKRYFCNKCGYVGISDLHPGCHYFSYPMANLEEIYIDHLEAELAALRASPASVPEGYALVPVEPTTEMWAAVNKLDDEMAAGGYDGKGCSIEQAWNCLLAAAPTPPSTDDRKDAEKVSK